MLQSACRGAVPKLPEECSDHPQSDEYATAEVRSILANRVRTEKWLRSWEKERSKPFGQRQFFSFAEIAERLAREPRTLVIDPDLRERVSRELVKWVQTQQFRSGDVVTLSGGDPPDFRASELPLPLADGGVVLLPDEAVALRGDACRRYAEARAELPGAPSLLRDWFGTEPLGPDPANAPGPGAARPGPRAGEQTGKDLACGITLDILADDHRRPPRGYSRLITIARLVNTGLPHRYADESISKMIRETVRDWEAKNLGK
jgi:hypothetical protein